MPFTPFLTVCGMFGKTCSSLFSFLQIWGVILLKWGFHINSLDCRSINTLNLKMTKREVCFLRSLSEQCQWALHVQNCPKLTHCEELHALMISDSNVKMTKEMVVLRSNFCEMTASSLTLTTKERMIWTSILRLL